jgi:hypothetical protein
MLIGNYRQLAVCNGLVANRIQHLTSGASIILTRRCYASYGILLNEPYNRTKHKGQKPYKSPLDGTDYAINQIDWFVIRGEPVVEGKHITRRYSRIISAKNPNKVWKDKIVVSRLPQDQLPQSITQGDAKVVFQVVSDLQSHVLDSRTEGVTKRHKHRFRLGRAYLQIDHEVAITIGPAGLSFWIRLGESACHEDNALSIEWARPQDGVAREEAMAELAESAEEDTEWQNSLIRNPTDPPQ